MNLQQYMHILEKKKGLKSIKLEKKSYISLKQKKEIIKLGTEIDELESRRKVEKKPVI